MAGQCVTLWIGEALGSVERACLLSILRHGHSIALYCYRNPKGVPKGVELRNASDVIPEGEIFFQRNGSVAAFSDWFRYALQRRAAGTWVDTDLYLLRPIEMEAPYLFGEESPGVINNAVLRLPADSVLLRRLLDVFEMRATPSWLAFRSYLRARAGQLIRGHVELSKLPWGATGPLALTTLARELGLSGQALPSDVFNPVPWTKADWILDPEIGLEDVTTDRTVAVHLWNHCIAGFKDDRPRSGSFLDRLQRESRRGARPQNSFSPPRSSASFAPI